MSESAQQRRVNGNIKMTAANPVFSTGGSYVSFPNGIYSSGGAAPSYFEGPLNARNVVKNDSGAILTLAGGISGVTNVSGTLDVVGGGTLRMNGNDVIDAGGGWHRTYGPSGWFSQTFGGGVYMTDTNYVRTFNGKGLAAASTITGVPGINGTGGPTAYGVQGQPTTVGYGGVIGYTQDGATFGILGHANAYSFYGGGSLYNVGSITASTSVNAVAFNYTSDRRLKKNIETIEFPLETIEKLRGVTFDWKETGKHDMGFIAQEVEQVTPYLVNENRRPSGEIFKSVQYGNLVALAVEAVKALAVKIFAIEASQNVLLNQVKDLQGKLSKADQENRELKSQFKAIDQRLSDIESKNRTGR
jgi:hypothetical protein